MAETGLFSTLAQFYELQRSHVHSAENAHRYPGMCVAGHIFKTINVHQMAHISSGDTQAIIPTFKTRWHVTDQHPETSDCFLYSELYC